MGKLVYRNINQFFIFEYFGIIKLESYINILLLNILMLDVEQANVYTKLGIVFYITMGV